MSENYPLAIWVPAHPSNFLASNRDGYGKIVVHNTDGHENAQPVAEMWQEKGHGSSAHFVIGQDGTVIQCVSIHDVAWHAHLANHDSIGIEHCARTPHELGPQDPGLVPSEAQYQASAKLVAWLLIREGMRPSRDVVLGHSEADEKTTHTKCPSGCGWDWDRYIGMVVRHYDEWTPTELEECI